MLSISWFSFRRTSRSSSDARKTLSTGWSFLPPSAPTATLRSFEVSAKMWNSPSFKSLSSMSSLRHLCFCFALWMAHNALCLKMTAASSKSPLTTVKTGYPLTSISWPYRGLRYLPIEVENFFEVFCWQVTSFQMIAGSSSFFSCIGNKLCLWAGLLRFWF